MTHKACLTLCTPPGLVIPQPFPALRRSYTIYLVPQKLLRMLSPLSGMPFPVLATRSNWVSLINISILDFLWKSADWAHVCTPHTSLSQLPLSSALSLSLYSSHPLSSFTVRSTYLVTIVFPPSNFKRRSILLNIVWTALTSSSGH